LTAEFILYIIIQKQGDGAMQIELKIDSSYNEPRIIIMTDSMTEEIKSIMDKLSESIPPVISGIKDKKLEVLEQSDIIRIYANSGKIFAITDNGEYTLRLRLYEIENKLNSNQFVRISNSEIINLKKVNNFDLSFTGTICVKLSNGETTYVSRRYVSKIKKILGI
jgi:DNA-binding LytR/AlgR family response regulator